MKQGESQTTKQQDEPVQGGQEAPPAAEGAGSPAAGQASPERVDWTAILQEHALVPDSEQASPVVMPEVADDLRIPRRRGLYVVVALVALFSVAASVAVVVALVRGGEEAESKPAAQVTPPPVAPPPRQAAPPPQATTPPPAPPAEPTKTPEPAQPAAADDEPEAEKPRARAEKKRSPSAESSKSEEKTASRSERARPRDGSRSAKDDEASAEPGLDEKPDVKADEKADEKADKADEKPGKTEPDKPAGPSKDDVARAVDKLVPRVATCAKQHGVSGMVAVRMQVEPSGSVAWSAVREGGSDFQGCVSRVLRDLRLPAGPGGTVVHTITLPAP
jgi:hypothetical protein